MRRSFARWLRRGAPRLRNTQPDWRSQLIIFAYRHFLGRTPDDREILDWTTALAGKLTPVSFLEQVADCAEAKRLARTEATTRDANRLLEQQQIIKLAYQLFLHRQPEAEEVRRWPAAMDAGLTTDGFIDAVAKSDEALHRRRETELGDGMTDGAFLVRTASSLFGRGLLPSEVAALQRQLELLPAGRMRFVAARINSQLHPAPSADAPAARQRVVHGTDRTLGREEWNARRRECFAGVHRPAAAAIAEPEFAHSGSFKVSMIASLYRGGRFIERFLQNITSQTMFHSSELIIIDAHSPEGEGEIIARYQQFFPNIVYKRVDFRIGIYDAWNLGVAMARGDYLTNTNVDDLRRHDSIALQAGFLDNHPGVSVAYQEFLYSLDADLSFEEVAKIGFRSELPIVTRHSLLACNAPHNAPMWRKSLHDSVGLFDTKYRSAGDVDFWLRCLLAGHRFGKINTPHVVYFHNPDGMSTRPDTPGVTESQEILGKYSAKLISPALLDTRQGFMARLGAGEVAQAGDARAYYDVAQQNLLALAKNRAVAAPAVERIGEGRVLRVLLDGLCFQHATRACGPILAGLNARLGVADGFELFVLDRGNFHGIAGLHRIEFPAYHGAYTAADSLLIQESCDAFGIDVFTSAGCTTALGTPQLQIVAEEWGVEAVTGRPVRAAKERCLAVAYSSRFACLSALARRQLFLHCPGTDPARVLPPVADASDGAKLWLDLCNAWRQTADADLNAKIDPFYRDWIRLRGLQAEVDVGVD